MRAIATRAVFFDVDFTLIHPGPMFQGVGYRDFCSAHGVTVDPARFSSAVAGASPLLQPGDGLYDPLVFIDYTESIIKGMGGCGDGIRAAAREIYDQWSACHHFDLYEDVPGVLRLIHGRDRIGSSRTPSGA